VIGWACFDGKTGEMIGDYLAVTRAATDAHAAAYAVQTDAEATRTDVKAAHEKSELEARARTEAEARAAALEARIRELESAQQGYA
jgi:hypothetical protein